MPRSIDQMLEEARQRIKRWTPQETQALVANGALLIDIRPAAQRKLEGEVPGALVIERNVLEWRLDPQSAYRIDAITHHQQTVIIFCSEGYTSSLAAFSLRQLGLENAGDLEGGIAAWKHAGLAVTVSP